MRQQIILIRHGEEPEGSSPDLSARGRARAERLAKYLPKEFGTPGALFAAAPSSSSVRCYLTLRPLADECDLIIGTAHKAEEFLNLAAKIRLDPALENRLVVVAWTHSELPSLAAALGVVRSDFPKVWNERVFDKTYLLRYKSDGQPKVRCVRQPF